jgi:hypothetical protein
MGDHDMKFFDIAECGMVLQAVKSFIFSITDYWIEEGDLLTVIDIKDISSSPREIEMIYLAGGRVHQCTIHETSHFNEDMMRWVKILE